MKQFGNLVLDTANECLWSGSTQIALQPKPFAVLRYLVEHPGRLITHDELLDALWPETFVQPQVLRTYILELRKLLGDDAGQPRFIQTLPKRGYSFVAAVSEQTKPTRSDNYGCTEQAGIFDRDAELETLTRMLTDAQAGQRKMIMLCGETGIGKTSLVDAFTRAAGNSILCGRGQCIPGNGHQEDFYPVMEALERLCASPEGETICGVIARTAPSWQAAMRPESCGGATAVPGERLPGSLCAALEEVSRIKPLLLVIEDLQWADAATLTWLAALARRRAPARLLVVGTYRPRSVSTKHPLKALRQELLLQRLAEEIVLMPLAKPVVLKLLSREAGGAELPAKVSSFIYERAEGNPMFALAFLRHLISQKLLMRGKDDCAGWKFAPDIEESAGIPAELMQMVELEIDRLSEHDQQLLEAGSLMPVAFPAWAVAAALEKDSCETEDSCEALARTCCFLLRAGSEELPDGSTTGFYAFSHGLYRDVLYQRQSSTRRARRHIRVAEKLALMFAGRESLVAREMAMHYEAAGNWRSGVQALLSAARYAMERGSNNEAADLLERALRITADRDQARTEAAAIREELANALANEQSNLSQKV